jgi:hypothetical protein
MIGIIEIKLILINCNFLLGITLFINNRKRQKKAPLLLSQVSEEYQNESERRGTKSLNWTSVAKIWVK